MNRSAVRFIMVIGLLAGSSLATTAEAQAPGRVRAQQQDLTTPADPGAVPGAGSALLDPREEMRKFVQSISAYARSFRRDFIVFTQNGLDLLSKADPGDETRVAPARTYMRAIDGVVQEGVFHGLPAIDQPTIPERRDPLLTKLATARNAGLFAFVLDYARSPQTVTEVHRLAAARGLVAYVAPSLDLDLGTPPVLPRSPYAAHGLSVLSIGAVKNFLYLKDSSRFGRQDEFALKVRETNFDMVVVDVLHRPGEPLTKRAVETLKYKNAGARRLALAAMTIGAAESHRYYWNAGWREGSPIWISAPFPGNPDKYFVEYWRPEWQAIMTGDARSYIYGIVDLGFDGVVLDGVEAYRFFEGGLEAVEDMR